jgi:hypothetical protein
MSYIIGRSIHLNGCLQADNQKFVKRPTFFKKLDEAIESAAKDILEAERIKKIALESLEQYRAIHIDGYYFFSGRKKDKKYKLTN